MRLPNPTIFSRSRLLARIAGFKPAEDFRGIAAPLSVWLQFTWYNVWSGPYYLARSLWRRATDRRR